MNEEELEKQIRIKKKLLSDYIRLRKAYNIDDETYWKFTDSVLDQLSVLIKKRKRSKTYPSFGRGFKNKDMNNNTDLLKEYASLAGKEDEKSEARKTEILNYIKLNADDSDREEAKAFINQRWSSFRVKS